MTDSLNNLNMVEEAVTTPTRVISQITSTPRKEILRKVMEMAMVEVMATLEMEAAITTITVVDRQEVAFSLLISTIITTIITITKVTITITVEEVAEACQMKKQ